MNFSSWSIRTKLSFAFGFVSAVAIATALTMASSLNRFQQALTQEVAVSQEAVEEVFKAKASNVDMGHWMAEFALSGAKADQERKEQCDDDFTKHMHTIEVRPHGFERLAPHVVALARAEGFDAHATSITLRQDAR